jgi:molybdate transport system permease protein
VLDQLSNPVVTDAAKVTIKTSVIAQLLILLFGTPAAFVLASRRFPGYSFAVTLVELPLVLPPAVAGIGLLAAFGHFGLLGSSLEWLGITLPFTQTAVTLAVAYVASPLYIRQAIAAFEATDPNLAAASRTLGASPARTFFRVILPLARGGLIAGLALSFARGIGEFGATIMFAGSLQAVTQTFSLAIYAEFARNFDATLAMSGALVLFSIFLLVGLRIGLTWQRSSSTRSTSLFGLTTSS